MKKLYDELSYFLHQKLFVILTLLTAVCSYGFAITHESIGVDDTLVELYLEDGLEPAMGRWTVYLINKLFHIGQFSPFITELCGMLLLLVAVVLFSVLVRRILEDRISILGYTAFACTFVSCPFISEVWVYYFHDGVDVGYILLALSLLLFMDGFGHTGKTRLNYLLGSMLFLWAAVGCYESFLILYLLGIIMILFFQGIAQKETPSFFIVKKLFVSVCLSVGCIILRFLMQKTLSAIFPLPNADFRNPASSLQIFADENWLVNIFMLVKRYWLVYCVNGAVYFPITVYVLSAVTFGIASVVYAVKNKNAWYPLLFLGMILVPGILTFVELKPPLYRACQYMPFFVASAMLILYLFLQKLLKKYGHIAFAVMAVCLVWNQAFESNYNFYTDYQKYMYDREVLTTIAKEVIKKYGKEAKVIFTGNYMPPYDLVKDYYIGYGSEEFQLISALTDWLDPHLKEKYYSPYGYCFAGEAKYSLIEWGLYAFYNPGLELAHFLQMHGYNLQVITDSELSSKANTFADNLPRWPENGSVTELDGYVIVHF